MEPNASAPAKGSAAGRFFTGCGLGCAGLVGLLFVFVIVFGVVSPSDTVFTGTELDEAFVAELRATDLLEEGENVIYLYATGVWDLREGGAFFTDRRAAIYEQDFDPLTSEQARYEEIAAIEMSVPDAFLEDAIITVERTDGSRFVLPVTTTEAGHEKFFHRLRKEWIAHGGSPEDGPTEAPLPPSD